MNDTQEVRIIRPYVGNDGLVRLVSEIRELYVYEVVTLGKTYARYISDLLSFINFHDSTDAYSKNWHTRNVQILTVLLRQHKAFVKHYFTQDKFSDETVREMLVRFNHGDVSVPQSGTDQSPSTSPNTADQNSGGASSRHHIPSAIVSLIVHCANEANLFFGDVTPEHFDAYYAGTLQHPLQARRNVEVVEFFSYLADRELVLPNWQHIIDKEKLIVSSSGHRYLTKEVMAATKSRLSRHPDGCNIMRIVDIIDDYIKEHKVELFD